MSEVKSSKIDGQLSINQIIENLKKADLDIMVVLQRFYRNGRR